MLTWSIAPPDAHKRVGAKPPPRRPGQCRPSDRTPAHCNLAAPPRTRAGAGALRGWGPLMLKRYSVSIKTRLNEFSRVNVMLCLCFGFDLWRFWNFCVMIFFANLIFLWVIYCIRVYMSQWMYILYDENIFQSTRVVNVYLAIGFIRLLLTVSEFLFIQIKMYKICNIFSENEIDFHSKPII